jgi:methionyl-tRNA formyltransferase
VIDGFEIACGSGSVIVTRVQRAGKKAMEAGAALQGLDLGARLA